jgi:hypothetical protein
MTRRLSYEEAAAELGVKESWLRDNIRQLPHGKLGRRVYFTDADLARIDQVFHVEPDRGPLARPALVPAMAGPHPLRDLKPLGGRRARTS